jgi:hypothetical protein
MVEPQAGRFLNRVRKFDSCRRHRWKRVLRPKMRVGTRALQPCASRPRRRVDPSSKRPPDLRIIPVWSLRAVAPTGPSLSIAPSRASDCPESISCFCEATETVWLSAEPAFAGPPAKNFAPVRSRRSSGDEGRRRHSTCLATTSRSRSDHINWTCSTSSSTR